jgi:peptide/nickel transport system ATP-binding protein
MSESIRRETGATTGRVRVRVENLRVDSAAGNCVVDQIGFEIREGEMLGLVGESGSGKTTVALALLGYTRAGLAIGGGSVQLDGEEIVGLPEKELRRMRGNRVAYVPQDPGTALNPALTIGVQLTELIAAHGGDRSEGDALVDGVLEDVGLGELQVRERYPYQLSGGQQQRVALAMAFLLQPAVIVLDEPTTGLDVSTQRKVLETLSAMCADRGVAGVFVSHDLSVVASLVDKVAVMYSGRVVEIGGTDQIFEAPTHPYTRALLKALPKLEVATVLEGLGGQPPEPHARPSGCRFAPRCEFAVDECSAGPVTLEPVKEGHSVRCLRHASLPAAEGQEAQVVRSRVVEPSAADGALTARGLSASYGGVDVVHRVDLSVAGGECVAIVGESGSGKTTLARCLVGLHDEYEGDVMLGDKPQPRAARDRSAEALRSVQYVFQNPYSSLNPRKSVRKLVEQPIRQFFDCSAEERHRRTLDALAGAALSERFLGLYPRQLSGGERQRVAIARALAAEPEILVCDEVTSALDVSVQAVVVEALRRLQAERNLAIVFVTHNLALVRSISEQVVVVKGGRVVEAGPTEAVLTSPAHEYTKALLRDVPNPSFGAVLTSQGA